MPILILSSTNRGMSILLGSVFLLFKEYIYTITLKKINIIFFSVVYVQHILNNINFAVNINHHIYNSRLYYII